ncbi:MAG: CPBP family intramembrane metalloprotease [Spirochaetes bacterium]|nr:CPBP family intramembrane metalloprotease [Spirochaetota bacterium]
MKKNIILTSYFIGSIIVSIPILISIAGAWGYISLKYDFFDSILNIIHFRFSFITLLILFIAISTALVIDMFFFKNKKQFNKNLHVLENIFGKKINIFFNFSLSLLAGYFEELVFRVYLYLFLLFIIQKITTLFFYVDIVIIILISLIFAFLHILQGKLAFILSFIFSIIFFISIKLSNCIWYAIIAHAVFNFLELAIIFPLHKKQLGTD